MLLIPLVALVMPGSGDAAGSLPIIGDWVAAARPNLAALLAVFVTLLALQALLTRFKNMFNHRTTMAIAERLRLELFSAMSLARWGALQRRRAGDLNHTLTSDVGQIMGAISSALSLFQSGFMLLIYLAVATAVSWQMAGFAVLVGGGLFATLYPVRRRARAHGQELVGLYQAQNATVLEFISSIRLAKLFTAEHRQVNAYARQLGHIRTAILQYAQYSTWGTVAFQVGIAAIAALFVWLAVSVFALDLARIGLLLVIFSRLAPRFGSLQENAQSFLSQAPAYANYRKLLRYFEENLELNEEPGSHPPRLREAIVLSGVTLAFGSTAEPSISDISFAIPAGRVTALIGPSGSGKSTVADVVLGLLSPDSGTVTVDGIALNESNRRAWRGSVASVPQDAFLLNDTIAANLRLANAGAADAELWEALEMANIAELVRSLPARLDTLAGDRGQRFSGGERQRLALARALLRRPQLLVLDEATSALDWQNQQIVAATIERLRGSLTILTIAHRPSLIAFADQVITLNDGQVVERGNYAELKQRPESALARMLAAEGGGGEHSAAKQTSST